MAAAIPAVEVAHHGDPAGIRRPDHEAHAAHAIHLPGLCAETASQLTVVAFGKQMNVHLPQLRTEGVGILGFLNAATPVDAQPIGLTLGQLTGEQPRYLLLHEAQGVSLRSEEHTSELQSRPHLVCRLLLEKKKK